MPKRGKEVSSVVGVEVRRVRAAEWRELRELRLRALADVPEPDPGRMQLVGMWVDPQRRRRGVAQALIDQAVRWSRDHQGRELIAWVAETNAAARLLYARVGFQPAGARQPLPSNPAVEELLLRLPLTAGRGG